MPNWCYNNLEVRGEPQELRKFIEAMRYTGPQPENSHDRIDWDINQFFPIPKELEETTASFGHAQDDAHAEKMKANQEKYGVQDWYEWAHANWDSKWGACRVEFDERDIDTSATSYYIKFESAWSPPVGLIRKVSELFPNLIFSMHCTEEANFFACYFIFHKGEIVHDADFDTEPSGEWKEKIDSLEGDEDKEDEYFEALSDWEHYLLFTVSEACDKAMSEYAESVK
jgi:hypothetical protein